jgi:hypothetical protein
LLDPSLPPSSPLTPVEPLAVDFNEYARQWREHAARSAA